MTDMYAQPPEEQQPYAQPPKKGMSGWLIALIVVLVLVVLCCLCIAVSWLVAAPSMGNVFSQIIETIEATTPAP